MDNPRCRERSFKNKALHNFLTETYPKLLEPIITRDTRLFLMEETMYYDRWWRKILEREPDLRGSDYDKRKQLSESKQIELGYEVGANIRLKI